MITALMVELGKHPWPVQLCNDAGFLQRAVSIEEVTVCSVAVERLTDDVVILYNNKGVCLGLDGNRRVGNKILAGVFYIVGCTDGELTSLPDSEIVRYTARFWDPEFYDVDEVQDSWLDSLEAEMEEWCSLYS